jgi:hypothetical protein
MESSKIESENLIDEKSEAVTNSTLPVISVTDIYIK